jgi:hypothetical protein
LLTCLLLLAPWEARAGDGLVTVNLLPLGGPGQDGPFLSFDITDPLARGGFSLPTATLTATNGGAHVSNYSMALPVLKLAGASFSPRYGDQRLEMDFPARALSGIRLDARHIRGLALSAKSDSHAVNVMLGQLRSSGTSLAAVPRVMAVTSKLALGPKLSLTPRLVVPLGAQQTPGSASSNVGTGFLANVTSHLRFAADLSTARTASRRWAPLAVVGALGQWSRAAVEASLTRATAGYTLLGSVPFADRDRALLRGRAQVVRNVTLSASVTRARPRGGAGAKTHELGLEVSRFSAGVFALAHQLTAEPSRTTEQFVVSWKQSGASRTVRMVEEHVRARSTRRADVQRRLHVEIGAIAKPRWNLDWDSSVLVSSNQRRRASRVGSRVRSRLKVLDRVSMTGELQYGLFGAERTLFDLRSLKLGSDVKLSSRTTVQVGYTHTPGSALPLYRRLHARLVRTLSF